MPCKVCKKLIISQAVTFTGGILTINIPEGSYNNGCSYCLLIAQEIPAATTITAPVVVTIGTGTAQYPIVNKCCVPVIARNIRTRTKYGVVVATTATGANFKLLGDTCCSVADVLDSIDGTDPTAA